VTVRSAFACRRHVMLVNAGDGWGAYPMTLSCAVRTVRTLHPLGYRNAMYAAIMPG